jgi:hypothetical protein
MEENKYTLEYVEGLRDMEFPRSLPEEELGPLLLHITGKLGPFASISGSATKYFQVSRNDPENKIPNNGHCLETSLDIFRGRVDTLYHGKEFFTGAEEENGEFASADISIKKEYSQGYVSARIEILGREFEQLGMPDKYLFEGINKAVKGYFQISKFPKVEEDHFF